MMPEKAREPEIRRHPSSGRNDRQPHAGRQGSAHRRGRAAGAERSGRLACMGRESVGGRARSEGREAR